MMISAMAAWWIAAGLLVGAELLTGTFYLLMLAIGVVGGAMAAQFGMSTVAQMVVAAVIGGGAVVAWHAKRRSQPRAAPAASNRDVNLDIGERVFVSHWDAQGETRVEYRGTQWPARHVGEGPAQSGEHVIRAIEGNRLLLQR
jgi:membrane protein implicated in regulation of membrane protease activity